MASDHSVFLSYSPEDQDYVRVIADAIQSSGYDVWYDHEITAGVAFGEQIERALTDSEAIVLLLSSASARSKWVGNEVALALRQNKHVIPVLLDERGTQTPLMSLVGDLMMINAIDQSPERVSELIIEALAAAVPISHEYAAQPFQEISPPKDSSPRLLRMPFAGGLILAVLVVTSFWVTFNRPEEEPVREVQRLIANGVSRARLGSITEAIDIYQQAAELDPQNPLTFQLMGYAYLHRAQQRPGVYPEDASMAVSNLERSVQLDPKYFWAAYNLSLAYWEIGEKEKAISTLRDLLEMEPSMRATIREDGQFDPLRASPEFQAEFGGDR